MCVGELKVIFVNKCLLRWVKGCNGLCGWIKDLKGILFTDIKICFVIFVLKEFNVKMPKIPMNVSNTSPKKCS